MSLERYEEVPQETIYNIGKKIEENNKYLRYREILISLTLVSFTIAYSFFSFRLIFGLVFESRILSYSPSIFGLLFFVFLGFGMLNKKRYRISISRKEYLTYYFGIISSDLKQYNVRKVIETIKLLVMELDTIKEDYASDSLDIQYFEKLDNIEELIRNRVYPTLLREPIDTEINNSLSSFFHEASKWVHNNKLINILAVLDITNNPEFLNKDTPLEEFYPPGAYTRWSKEIKNQYRINHVFRYASTYFVGLLVLTPMFYFIKGMKIDLLIKDYGDVLMLSALIVVGLETTRKNN